MIASVWPRDTYPVVFQQHGIKHGSNHSKNQSPGQKSTNYLPSLGQGKVQNRIQRIQRNYLNLIGNADGKNVYEQPQMVFHILTRLFPFLQLFIFLMSVTMRHSQRGGIRGN